MVTLATLTAELGLGARHAARLGRALRRAAGVAQGTSHTPIAVVPGAWPPTLRGKRPHWLSPRTGLEVQPSYKMKLTRDGYQPGTLRIEVGQVALKKLVEETRTR